MLILEKNLTTTIFNFFVTIFSFTNRNTMKITIQRKKYELLQRERKTHIIISI